MPRGWYQTPSGWLRSLRRVIVRVPEHVVQPSRIVSLGHRRAVVQWSDVGVRLLARAVSGSRSLDSTQTSFFRKPGQGWPSWRWRTGSRQPPVSSNEPSAELAPSKHSSLGGTVGGSQIGRRTSASAFARWRRPLVQVKPDGRRHSAHSSCAFRSRVGTVEIFRARVVEREGRIACTTPFQCTLRRARTEATSKSVIQHSGVGSVESRGSRAERDSRSGSTRSWWRFFCSDGDVDRQRRVEFPQCEHFQSIADNMIRSARHGVRCVRVGEAKHPGPPRANTSTDQPETGVVEVLEFDLTQADPATM